MQQIEVDGELVEIIGARQARVESRSQEGLWYAVSLEGDHRSCTCAGYTHRGSCRHLDAAENALRLSIAAFPRKRTGLDLATSRYQSRELILDSGRHPVGITLGQPRFKLGYTIRRVSDLAPKGLMQIEDDSEFERLYRHRLDSFGLERIAERLRQIAEDAGTERLVLLCFEDCHKGEFCHRRVFAAWWEEQTGTPVPELGPPLPETLS